MHHSCNPSRMKLTDNSSVKQWLEDLRLMCESECMCVLQGKSLTQESSDLVLTSLKSTKDSIDTIKGRAHVVSTEFTKLHRRVRKERWSQVFTCGMRVVGQIRSLLNECSNSFAVADSETVQLHQQVVTEGCGRLSQYLHSRVNEVDVDSPPDAAFLMKLMSSLGHSFSALVDLSLGLLIQQMLQSLDEPTSPYDLKSTLSHLVSLGLEGDHMCYLISREGGVQRLFEVCRSPSQQYGHAQALRAIATVCCITESIHELEMVKGVEFLTDLLADSSVPGVVRSEAAGVIAQITSPCLDHYHHLTGFIENMEDMVRSLTDLCIEASSAEVFLLACAALANMTFMDSLACDFLAQYHTPRVLIEACTLKKAQTIFAKDQVATVLANMAAIEVCCVEITENSGAELLIHFLFEGPSEEGTATEAQACERVQQKAAIALTRLCKDPEVAQTMLDLQGMSRLVQLCRDPVERNHSDSVLVACLAALRKVSSVLGLEVGDETKLSQLSPPKLKDSFLMCSNLDESVV
ncbi:hypothetical protein CAPTEDRAFT_182206 [Capitella teleta]|uniref:Uncharacterized protein n=1 Tax=Capitella teleta TaxID=283909 RepID=R7TU52_CAPTE|nr:hypothetical protein CAPTEDRAFT_182206 [Capitella teleta]|eukprot:ELT97127.1 hypothetical protein CAPTEDRAFT_182206 [Capitella teleta]